MRIAYPATFETYEAGRILVGFRDLPEAHTDGADLAEAKEEALDLLNSVLAGRMKYREDMPRPSKRRKGETMIIPDADLSLKVALYMAMGETGMTAAQLTRELAIGNKDMQRILDPMHATKTARMNEAIVATGRRAVVQLL